MKYHKYLVCIPIILVMCLTSSFAQQTVKGEIKYLEEVAIIDYYTIGDTIGNGPHQALGHNTAKSFDDILLTYNVRGKNKKFLGIVMNDIQLTFYKRKLIQIKMNTLTESENDTKSRLLLTLKEYFGEPTDDSLKKINKYAWENDKYEIDYYCSILDSTEEISLTLKEEYEEAKIKTHESLILDSKGPILKFDDDVIEFDWQQEAQYINCSFTNHGNVPLEIIRVIVIHKYKLPNLATRPIGYMIPIKPKEKILPGKSGIIKIKYDKRRKIGTGASYRVLVLTNAVSESTNRPHASIILKVRKGNMGE